MKNNDVNIMEFLKIGDYKIAKDRMYLSSHEWVLDNQDGTYTCLLYTSPSPRDS